MTKATDYKRKWNEENLDRIYLTVPKGEKETIRRAAKDVGISVNEYINRLIDCAILPYMNETGRKD